MLRLYFAPPTPPLTSDARLSSQPAVENPNDLSWRIYFSAGSDDKTLDIFERNPPTSLPTARKPDAIGLNHLRSDFSREVYKPESGRARVTSGRNRKDSRETRPYTIHAHAELWDYRGYSARSRLLGQTNFRDFPPN